MPHGPAEPLHNLGLRCRPHAVGPDRFQKVGEIVSRGSMEGEYARRGHQGERKGLKPLPVPFSHLVACQQVRAAHVCRFCFEHLPLVVSPHCRQIKVQEPVGSCARLDTSGEQITKVDDAVDAALFNVGHHRIKGQQVAMDIRDDGDSHLPSLMAVLEPLLESPYWAGWQRHDNLYQ